MKSSRNSTKTSREYSKPTITAKKVKLNFFYDVRMDDSLNQLLSAEIFLASSHGGGGCGSGSSKDIENPV